MNGQGTYTHPNGSKYIGEHKDDHPNGQGTMIYPDGEKCEGEWVNAGFWNGKCLLQKRKHPIQVREWKKDKTITSL